MKSKLLLGGILLSIIPVVTLAADPTLVGIPGISGDVVPQFGDYINALYRLSISAAALLAVVKIVMAGAKYMLTDIVTTKGEAKKDIQGALTGLLIVIGAVLILNTVNTDITQNQIAINPLEVDGNDSLTDELRRLTEALSRSRAACEADPDCKVITVNYKEDCDKLGGTFTNGNLVKRLIGENAISSGEFWNYCFYYPETAITIITDDLVDTGITIGSFGDVNMDDLRVHKENNYSLRNINVGNLKVMVVPLEVGDPPRPLTPAEQFTIEENAEELCTGNLITVRSNVGIPKIYHYCTTNYLGH